LPTMLMIRVLSVALASGAEGDGTVSQRSPELARDASPAADGTGTSARTCSPAQTWAGIAVAAPRRLTEDGVQIHPPHKSVHIQRVYQEVDYALRGSTLNPIPLVPE
jgi:hypothetical protein